MSPSSRRGLLRSAVVGSIAGVGWGTAFFHAASISSRAVRVIGSGSTQIILITGSAGTFCVQTGEGWHPPASAISSLLAGGGRVDVGIKEAVPVSLTARELIPGHAALSVSLGDVTLAIRYSATNGTGFRRIDVTRGTATAVITDAPTATGVHAPSLLITPRLPADDELARVCPAAVVVNASSLTDSPPLPVVRAFPSTPVTINLPNDQIELPGRE